MSDFSATLLISIVSVYIAMFGIFITYYILRRDRKRQAYNYLPEINRWLENADAVEALGWKAAAVMLGYTALEQTLRGIAKKRMLSEADATLSLLARKLVQEKVMDEGNSDLLNKVTDIRNRIVHGKADSVPKEELQFAYVTCKKLSEQLTANF